MCCVVSEVESEEKASVRTDDRCRYLVRIKVFSQDPAGLWSLAVQASSSLRGEASGNAPKMTNQSGLTFALLPFFFCIHRGTAAADVTGGEGCGSLVY